MSRDLGSRDREFLALTRQVRAGISDLTNATSAHTVIPLQGSGTFAIEAAIGTLVPASGKLLILQNGAYGKRAEKIARKIGREAIVLETDEDTPVSVATLDAALAADASITDIFAVHLETTSGILNPIEEIAKTASRRRRRLHVDAMSSFGGIHIDVATLGCTSLVSSSNKCLEGVPGVAFAICEISHLKSMEDNSPSVCLDLHDQWREFERSGQWRFTPPTHVMMALKSALDQLRDEGGVEQRHRRYQALANQLIAGLVSAGFEMYLAKEHQSPVIVTVRQPDAPWFSFDELYESLKARGITIYPGKLTKDKSFRIGCIGSITKADIDRTLAAIREYASQARRRHGISPSMDAPSDGERI